MEESKEMQTYMGLNKRKGFGKWKVVRTSEGSNVKNMFFKADKKSIELYDRAKDLLNQMKESFVDPDFLANESSIQHHSENYVWRKALDILGPDAEVFEGDIEPKDIIQGGLGDCYLLSSLAVLSEVEEKHHYIERIFHTKKTNKKGLYAIWLCIDGVWKLIFIDDQIVCVSPTSGPAFSKANGPELWVLLLEKCYAKAYGSFGSINFGKSGECINDLTGAPYMNFDSQNPG